jgi:hypothetical protein
LDQQALLNQNITDDIQKAISQRVAHGTAVNWQETPDTGQSQRPASADKQ